MAAPHFSSGDKAALRARMRALRSGCDPGFGLHLAAHLLGSGAILPGAVVGGYWPLAGEIDIRPLLLALAGRGHAVALPQTPRRGEALRFHRWRPGEGLLGGRFGTQHPAHDPLIPDVLLVPLLAFDRRFHRLGYGAGYYDRTLALWPCRAIGCGFALQEVARVPDEPHDRALDAVATEAGLLR